MDTTQEVISKPQEEEKKEKRIYRKVRKKVFVEEEVEEKPNTADYELVTFRFWNDEQKGIPVDYQWVDRWIKPGKCKGIFRDGQTYTLPRIAYEYYRDQCSMPKMANIDQELVPGQFNKAAKEVGRIYRFRLEVVR